MTAKQSLDLVLREPPNPNPVRTLAIFENPDADIHGPLIINFLEGVSEGWSPKWAKFTQDVREEALKAVMEGTVTAVEKTGKLLCIYVREPG